MLHHMMHQQDRFSHDEDFKTAVLSAIMGCCLAVNAHCTDKEDFMSTKPCLKIHCGLNVTFVVGADPAFPT